MIRAARPLRLLAAALLGLALAGAAQGAQKVLRVAYLIAETNFDPAFVSDTYSNNVVAEIFEAPLTYDPLARPAKLKPQTLEAMPEVSEGGKTYTLRLKMGILFADDPAFGGNKRELTAADYEFAFKRLMDPKVSSPNLWLIEGRIAGIEEAIANAKKSGGRFDYDARVSGIEVVDRYTLRIRLTKPDYNFLYILAMPNIGGQAREVVERYGGEIGAHPVGTGAFRLAEWKRSSRIVLVRNENFREVFYEAEPPAEDAISRQLHAEMKGKRVPQVDRVEISIIEEAQPRWLAFLNGEIDWVNVPLEFIKMALPGGKLAPWLEKRGIRYIPDIDPDVTYMYWNMKDPVFGGYTPERIALRRAISLAYDNESEIQLLRNGMALEAQTPLPPGVLGYDPNFRLGKTYDPAKAKALLDMFGYVDRNGDGWRDQPDGSPLTLVYATGPSYSERQFTELWKRSMTEVGVRMDVEIGKWPDLRKKSKLGKLQSWHLAWSADYPDGENFYQLLYGPNCGSSNDGCFEHKEFDALYEKLGSLAPGPERARVFDAMARIMAVYAPWKLFSHRMRNQLLQPWILGWRKHPFLHESYKYVDIDLERRAKGPK